MPSRGGIFQTSHAEAMVTRIMTMNRPSRLLFIFHSAMTLTCRSHSSSRMVLKVIAYHRRPARPDHHQLATNCIGELFLVVPVNHFLDRTLAIGGFDVIGLINLQDDP